MDEKLTALITRIEQSALSDKAKAQLYTMISAGLQASVWPVLMKYVPAEDLAALAEDPNDKEKVTRYTALIATAVEEGNALDEIETVMNGLIDEVDAALTEEHI